MKVRGIASALAVLSIFIGSAAYANSSFSETKVARLTVHDYGTAVLVGLPANVTNAEKCSINNQLILAKSHPSFRETYTALLAAYSSGSKIAGWVNGCDTTFGGLKLTRLDLIK